MPKSAPKNRSMSDAMCIARDKLNLAECIAYVDAHKLPFAVLDYGNSFRSFNCTTRYVSKRKRFISESERARIVHENPHTEGA